MAMGNKKAEFSICENKECNSVIQGPSKFGSIQCDKCDRWI